MGDRLSTVSENECRNGLWTCRFPFVQVLECVDPPDEVDKNLRCLCGKWS